MSRMRAYLTIGDLERAGAILVLRCPRCGNTAYEYALNVRTRLEKPARLLDSIRFRCRCGNRQVDVWPRQPMRFSR